MQLALWKKHLSDDRNMAVVVITLLSAFLLATMGMFSAAMAEDVVTVTYWDFRGHTADLVAEMIADFNANIGKTQGIQIELSNHQRKYDQILAMSLDSGDLPDLFVQREQFIERCTQENLLIPIEEMPGGPEFLTAYGVKETFLPNLHVINGKTYSVPTRQITIKLVYNKELFVKAGLVDAAGQPTPPKTWQDVREYAKKITALEPGVTYGIIFPMKGSATGDYTYFWDWKIIRPFAASLGQYYFDFQKGQYNFSAFKPGLELALALKQDGSVAPGELSISDDAARVRFGQEGTIGMYVAATWDVGVFNDQYPAKIDWGVAEVPVLDTQATYKNLATVVPGVVISAAVKKKDLAKVMAVFQYLHSDAWLARLYEEAKDMPVRQAVISAAKKTPDKKGWVEFSQNPHTAVLPLVPNNLLTVSGPLWYQVFQDIYDGRQEMDAALADLDQRYNAAYQAAIADGKLAQDTFLIPEFDLRILP